MIHICHPLTTTSNNSNTSKTSQNSLQIITWSSRRQKTTTVATSEAGFRVFHAPNGPSNITVDAFLGARGLPLTTRENLESKAPVKSWEICEWKMKKTDVLIHSLKLADLLHGNLTANYWKCSVRGGVNFNASDKKWTRWIEHITQQKHLTSPKPPSS